jgi:hypothetical protein
MNSDTHEIEEVKDNADAAAKGLVPIPSSEIETIRVMTTDKRAKWIRINTSRAERRKLKRKAQRQARKKQKARARKVR